MAISATTSQLIPTMLEQVNPNLPSLLSNERSKFANMFEKANPKHQVSVWSAGTVGSGGVSAFRVPVWLSNGGDYQGITLDGGDLGTGSQGYSAFMTLGPFESDIAYNVPYRSTIATKTNKQAIVSALTKAVGGAIKEQALYDEIGLFQAGDGVLATATAVDTTTGTAGATLVYTLDTAFGPNRLRGYKALLDITDSAGVIRSTSARVAAINWAANTVSVVVGTTFTAAATDQLVFPGMGPVTSTTIASGSWRYGLYTYNTTTTSGSLNGLAYSAAAELACPVVNAAGGAWNASLVFAGKSQITQRRDDKQIEGLVGVCHTAQRTAWYLQGLTIANNMLRNGESVKSTDTAGQGTELSATFEAGDITTYVSRYANKTRVDNLVPKNFGQVQEQETQFFTSSEGQRMFVGRSATTGNPQAGQQFYVVATNNLYSIDPGCSIVTYSLSIPAGQ